MLGSGIWRFWAPKALISGVPTKCCPEGAGLRNLEVLGPKSFDFRSPHQLLPKRSRAPEFGGFGPQKLSTNCCPKGARLRNLEVLGPKSFDFRSRHRLLPKRFRPQKLRFPESPPIAAQKVLGSGIWRFWAPKALISGVPTKCCPEGAGLRNLEVLGPKSFDFRSPHQMLPTPEFGGFGPQKLRFPESPPSGQHLVGTPEIRGLGAQNLQNPEPRTFWAASGGGSGNQRFGDPKPPKSGAPDLLGSMWWGLRKSKVWGPKTSKIRSPGPSGQHVVGTPEIKGLGAQNLQNPEPRTFWAASGGDSGNQRFGGPKPPKSGAPDLLGSIWWGLRKSEVWGPKTSKIRSPGPSGQHVVGAPEIRGLGTQNLQNPEPRTFWAACGGDSGNQRFGGPKPPKSGAQDLLGSIWWGLRKSEVWGPKTSKIRSPGPSGQHVVGTAEIRGLGTQNLQNPEPRTFWAASGGDSGNQRFGDPKPPKSGAPDLLGSMWWGLRKSEVWGPKTSKIRSPEPCGQHLVGTLEMRGLGTQNLQNPEPRPSGQHLVGRSLLPLRFFPLSGCYIFLVVG